MSGLSFCSLRSPVGHRPSLVRASHRVIVGKDGLGCHGGGDMARAESAFGREKQELDREAEALVSDEELLCAMRAWTLSDIYVFADDREEEKKNLRRSIAAVLKKRAAV